VLAQLVAQGAQVLATGRDVGGLNAAIEALGADRKRVVPHAADLAVPEQRVALCHTAERFGINVIVNNAGTSDFAWLAEQAPEAVVRSVNTNVVAPIDLCRLLLHHLERQPSAHIVNVGSVFGSLGYAGFSVYSATKFALRGFSEALRRELAGTRVKVHYLAPRATRTQFNSRAVERMNAALGIAMDDPRRVAAAVIRLLRAGDAEMVIGWPERFFVRMNALLPRLVDRALRGQLGTIRAHAHSIDRSQRSVEATLPTT
jgi:short-subunit dehydrogenase